jgi:hypothetical protein
LPDLGVGGAGFRRSSLTPSLRLFLPEAEQAIPCVCFGNPESSLNSGGKKLSSARHLNPACQQCASRSSTPVSLATRALPKLRMQSHRVSPHNSAEVVLGGPDERQTHNPT